MCDTNMINHIVIIIKKYISNTNFVIFYISFYYYPLTIHMIHIEIWTTNHIYNVPKLNIFIHMIHIEKSKFLFFRFLDFDIKYYMLLVRFGLITRSNGNRLVTLTVYVLLYTISYVRLAGCGKHLRHLFKLKMYCTRCIIIYII